MALVSPKEYLDQEAAIVASGQFLYGDKDLTDHVVLRAPIVHTPGDVTRGEGNVVLKDDPVTTSYLGDVVRKLTGYEGGVYLGQADSESQVVGVYLAPGLDPESLEMTPGIDMLVLYEPKTDLRTIRDFHNHAVIEVYIDADLQWMREDCRKQAGGEEMDMGAIIKYSTRIEELRKLGFNVDDHAQHCEEMTSTFMEEAGGYLLR